MVPGLTDISVYGLTSSEISNPVVYGCATIRLAIELTVSTHAPYASRACTLIRALNGDVPIEQLAVGNLIATPVGYARSIVRIGVSWLSVTRGRCSAATPVIARKAHRLALNRIAVCA